MRIFITGGSGFIGRYVVERLKNNGHQLLLLSRSSNQSDGKVNFIRGDLAAPDQWKDKLIGFKPEATIHLAWENIPQYDALTSSRNLIYGLNLLRTLAETTCRSVLITGSVWEYVSAEGGVGEDHALVFENNFSVAKNTLHYFAKEMTKNFRMKLAWARLFYVYGPGQRSGALIPSIIDNFLNNREPGINNPDNSHDFVYVDDVARALAMIVKNGNLPDASVYNIGSGRLIRAKTIVDIIYNRKIESFACKGLWADTSKINQDVGWKAEIGIEEGIKRTVNFYKNFLKR